MEISGYLYGLSIYIRSHMSHRVTTRDLVVCGWHLPYDSFNALMISIWRSITIRACDTCNLTRLLYSFLTESKVSAKCPHLDRPTTPMSVLSPSQDQSFHNCRWAWCHSTFSNNAGLVHHVIQEHVLRAIPVKRRDICMIRRAEEGKGESLELMIDMYSYSSGQSSCHKSGTGSLILTPPSQ